MTTINDAAANDNDSNRITIMTIIFMMTVMLLSSILKIMIITIIRLVANVIM